VASLGGYPDGNQKVFEEVWSNLFGAGFRGLMFDGFAHTDNWDIATSLPNNPQLIASATQDCGASNTINLDLLYSRWQQYSSCQSGKNPCNPWVALAFDTSNALSCEKNKDNTFCSRMSSAFTNMTKTDPAFMQVPMFYNVEVVGGTTTEKTCTTMFKSLEKQGFNLKSIGDAYSTGNTGALNPCTDVVQSNPCLMQNLNQKKGSQQVWNMCKSAAAFSYFDADRFPCETTVKGVTCSPKCVEYITKEQNFAQVFPSKPSVCFPLP
jgi:hypothetical protein